MGNDLIEKKIFKSKLNFLTYILFLPILFLLLFLIMDLIINYRILIKEIGIPTIYWILLIFISFLLILSTILIFTYHTLRYEFMSDHLLLIYGPFKEKIYYKDIISWEFKNLLLIPISLVGLPGISLFDRFYSNEGKVRMYGTSMESKVLLIYTNKRKYGITPQNEESFILELEKKWEGG